MKTNIETFQRVYRDIKEHCCDVPWLDDRSVPDLHNLIAQWLKVKGHEVKTNERDSITIEKPDRSKVVIQICGTHRTHPAMPPNKVDNRIIKIYSLRKFTEWYNQTYL